MPKLYKPFCDGEDPKANDSLQKQSMSSCTKKELFIIVLHDSAHINVFLVGKNLSIVGTSVQFIELPKNFQGAQP